MCLRIFGSNSYLYDLENCAIKLWYLRIYNLIFLTFVYANTYIVIDSSWNIAGKIFLHVSTRWGFFFAKVRLPGSDVFEVFYWKM